MCTYPLELLDGHLFIELDGARWLIDTGAPTSFGDPGSVSIEGENLDLPRQHNGLTVQALRDFVGVTIAGLLGTDVLNLFDHVYRISDGKITLSQSELHLDGDCATLKFLAGTPIVDIRIGGLRTPVFFDTGAQLSYLRDDLLAGWPAAGEGTDFYPGVGEFQIQTFSVSLSLAGVPFTVRCGALPGLLGMTVLPASVHGILSNAILHSRVVGYFPRRCSMVV